jgi:two-component system LytT family response regulator
MLKVLILEDEIYTLEFLDKLISSHPLVTHTFATSVGADAIDISNKVSIDLAFLDIELAAADNLNGIQVAKLLRSANPDIQLVFVTGYTNYALEGYSVHPYDYIVKPINKDRVLTLITELVKIKSKSLDCQNDNLVVRSKNKIVFINPNDIYFVEKQKKKAFIHSRCGIYETVCTSSELELVLPDFFIKVHQSFIVNMKMVSEVEVTTSRTYEIHFYGYAGTALMSRAQFEINKLKFSPSF